MAIDREILVSLHGRRLGLTKDGNLVCDEKLMAPNGNAPAQSVVWYDDFLGDALGSPYNFQEGTDSGTSDAAINVQKGGVVRITTGDSATHTMAGNGAQLDLGALNWYASNGGLAMETRVKLDGITDVALFIGFTDQTSALEMPWDLSVVTYTSNQSDGCGFLFDTAATTDTIRCVGVKNNTDATLTDTGLAYVAATWMKLRIEVDTAGIAKFFIDGVLVATMADALTTTVALVPVFAIYSSATASVLLDVDYLHVKMDR